MNNDSRSTPVGPSPDAAADLGPRLSPEEFSHIYSSYWPYLLAIARSLVGDSTRLGETASDIVQRVFLAAQRGAEQGRGPTADGKAMRAYLARILHNMNIDDVRRTKAIVNGGGMAASGEVDALENDTTSPSGKVAREEERVRVAAALSQLRPDQARILIWRHYEDLTFGEIASRAGCSETGAKKAYARAKSALGALYGGSADPEDPAS